MSTTRARSRASFTAVSTGPFDAPPAARNTWSAPRPLVSSASACSTAAMPSSVGAAQNAAPACSARVQRSSITSSPTTRTPAATRRRTTSWPTRPRPITHAVSPSWTSPWRTPCMAMAPTVEKAACSAATPGEPGRTC